MKVTFLVGLPGSGKTHLGEAMSLEDEQVIYIDDISVQENPFDLIERSLGSPHLVISDVFLCRAVDRELAVTKIKQIYRKNGYSEPEIDWVFFENDPEKCYRNVDYRDQKGDHRAVKGTICSLSKDYQIPEDYTPVEIWQEDLINYIDGIKVINPIDSPMIASAKKELDRLLPGWEFELYIPGHKDHWLTFRASDGDEKKWVFISEDMKVTVE